MVTWFERAAIAGISVAAVAPEPMTTTFLSVQSKSSGHDLRVNDLTYESLHAFPLGRVAFRMLVVSLAHPEKIRGEANGVAVVSRLPSSVQRLSRARPAGAPNPVPVANVSIEAVFVDDFAEIGEISSAVAIGLPSHGLKR